MSARYTRTVATYLGIFIAALLLLEAVARSVGKPDSVPDATFIEAPEWGYPDHIAKDAEVFWRYRPDRRITDKFFATGRYTINSDGFRNPEIVADKPAGTQRVVCLGGSATFGLGVADWECYPRFLETSLNKLDPQQRRWQVINAGVTNYSTYQGVALARRWLTEWQPDIVVMSFSWGDHQPAANGTPDNRLSLPPAWWLKLENVLMRLAFVQWGKTLFRGGARPETPSSSIVIRRVSTPEFNANIEKMVLAARAAGARSIWATAPISWPPAGMSDTAGVFHYHHEYRDVARYAARSAGAEVAELANAFNLFPEFYDDPAIDIKHFNAAGHEFAGEFLARHILGLPQTRVESRMQSTEEEQ